MKITAFLPEHLVNACRKVSYGAEFGKSDSEEIMEEEIVNQTGRRIVCHLHHFIGDQRLA
jgi:hypothetical protein